MAGTLPYAFEDPTVVTRHWTVFEDDLEEELSKWPGFMAQLAANNAALRSKSASAYRAAAKDADLSDVPFVLKTLVEAVAEFGTSAA